MDKKFHTALTDRQQEIAQTALALLDLRNCDFAEQEIQETIDALAKPETPEPRVEHIPVFLNTGDTAPVGFGTIAGDRLFTQVDNALLVDGVARLIQVGDIKELYLGLGFTIAQNSFERRTEWVPPLTPKNRALVHDMAANRYSDAEIAQVMGVSENIVRRIVGEDTPS